MELVKGLGTMEAAVQTCVGSNNILWDPRGILQQSLGQKDLGQALWTSWSTHGLLGLVGISLPIPAPSSLGDHQGMPQQAHH